MWFGRRRSKMINQKPYSRVTSSFVTIISLLTLLILSGCAEETRSPSQTPMPTPPLEEEWSSDGIIKAREYYGSNNYGDYTMHWRSDEQYIYIGMNAKTIGWIAMAVQSGSRMKNAKAITMKNGKPATQGVCPTCGTKMFRIGKS